jgi:Zn-dependent protease
VTDIGQALVYYVVFLFSTTLHEAAHAWAALRGGDPTAYHGGQVSLNPLPHVRREPIGMLVLPLVTVFASGWPLGFASAPYDPAWAERHPRRAGAMALAGPLANLALVVAAGVGLRIGLAAGRFTAPEAVGFGSLVAAVTPDGIWSPLARLLSVFFSLNLLLGVFNLVPAPPLDGSGVVTLAMSDAAGRRYQEWLFRNRAIAWIGILVAWRYFDLLFHPLWLFAVNLLHTTARYG